MNVSFTDITDFLLKAPGSSVTLGNVHFENSGVGIIVSLPMAQWDMPAVVKDANEKLGPVWEDFVKHVEKRNAAGVIRPASVDCL